MKERQGLLRQLAGTHAGAPDNLRWGVFSLRIASHEESNSRGSPPGAQSRRVCVSALGGRPGNKAGGMWITALRDWQSPGGHQRSDFVPVGCRPLADFRLPARPPATTRKAGYFKDPERREHRHHDGKRLLRIRLFQMKLSWPTSGGAGWAGLRPGRKPPSGDRSSPFVLKSAGETGQTRPMML